MSKSRNHKSTTKSRKAIDALGPDESDRFFRALGARIREIRQTAQVSQADLARGIHITAPTLCRYEKATDPVPSEILRRIAVFLGIRLPELMDVTSDDVPSPGVDLPPSAQPGRPRAARPEPSGRRAAA